MSDGRIYRIPKVEGADGLGCPSSECSPRRRAGFDVGLDDVVCSTMVPEQTLVSVGFKAGNMPLMTDSVVVVVVLVVFSGEHGVDEAKTKLGLEGFL